MASTQELIVVGGGLAGCEAAWQAAERGIKVVLYEMRPYTPTGAHVTPFLAELVCSNSFGSVLPDRAQGVLKNEIRRIDSLLLKIAEKTAVPAGGALAVDREEFSKLVTETIISHPNIKLLRQEISSIPEEPAIIATGPLTSESLSKSIAQLTGREHLFFYDAIAPIVTAESVDMEKAYFGSRYDRGEHPQGDYINCPLSKEEYNLFIDQLLTAERIALKDFEHDLERGVKAGAHNFFEGCLPIEILARRGREALVFGPMRPVGLNDPHFNKRPYAVLQLRQDNLAGTLYNLVGFQTNLKIQEQERIFRLIPGLEKAVFIRYGQMHRNTFIFSPAHLLATMQYKDRNDLFFAGQITGVEGYMGNIATGLLAGVNAARVLSGFDPIELPQTTLLGALCNYITHATQADFQPMKANFGILSPLDDLQTMQLHGKRQRSNVYAERALLELSKYRKQFSVPMVE